VRKKTVLSPISVAMAEKEKKKEKKGETSCARSAAAGKAHRRNHYTAHSISLEGKRKKVSTKL